MRLLFVLLAGACLSSTRAEEVAENPFELAAAPEARTPLDAIVLARLRQLGIEPAHVCSDAVFVRRVFLDLIGTLPNAGETRNFLQDRRPNKRALLIDRLLQREEYADYWAMKWGDLLRVKAEFPINLWPNAARLTVRRFDRMEYLTAVTAISPDTASSTRLRPALRPTRSEPASCSRIPGCPCRRVLARNRNS